MSLRDKLSWAIPPRIQKKEFFSPYRGKFKLYKSGACNFEVLYEGKWYKIDANHPSPALYVDEDIPSIVVDMAFSALEAYVDAELEKVNKGGYVSPCFSGGPDNIPIYEQILCEVFEDVRFINSTMTRGIPY